jgi:hypothetical protein
MFTISKCGLVLASGPSRGIALCQLQSSWFTSPLRNYWMGFPGTICLLNKAPATLHQTTNESTGCRSGLSTCPLQDLREATRYQKYVCLPYVLGTSKRTEGQCGCLVITQVICFVSQGGVFQAGLYLLKRDGVHDVLESRVSGLVCMAYNWNRDSAGG